MAAIAQEKRTLAVETPLGKDVLALVSFTGQEEMSRLFHYDLEMLSEKDSIPARQIVGKNVTFRIGLSSGTPSYFNGIVSRFSAGGGETGLRRYHAEVVPWLWFLTRTSDCRIFQNKNAQEIVQQVFSDLGFSDFSWDLKGSPRKREYCVQYRETDFNFVSRLMEEEGIFYYFQHADGKHTLVLANHAGAYKDLPENEVEYRYTYGQEFVPDRLTAWEHQYAFISGKWAQTDYNFKDHPARGEPLPAKLLMTDEKTTVSLDNVDKFEVYDYPGAYEDTGAGRGLTKVRMEEEEATYDVVRGEGECKTFTPGGKFKIKRHECKAEEGKGYVVTSVCHSAKHWMSEVTKEAAEEYHNTFTCIPDSVTFRPRRVTPKAVVRGVQPAVVVGPAGEEIYVDKYGRVKVQFFWDREGKRDENSSCWVRVSQPWAGKNWGVVHNPRIGMEVVVSFVEGDPDRPLITGVVYNADYMPPYSLPDNKTQTGIQTRSSMGGGGANFNEIRFEDKKGSEQVFIHAEKNQDIGVENDETHWVGHDRQKTIDHDETTHVKHDRTETVDNNETITIHGNRTETVDKDETITIHANRTETVDKNESITIGGGRTESVAKDESITIGASRTESVAKNESITIGGGRTENVAKDESITIGGGRTESVAKNESVTIAGARTESVGKTLAITAADSITLTTGSASITMQKDGTITIRGKDISIIGSGQITGKASKDMVLKGQKILQN
jgi:type VI secretion system secreted protein VgrG